MRPIGVITVEGIDHFSACLGGKRIGSQPISNYRGQVTVRAPTAAIIWMLYYDCAEESQTLRKALYQLAVASISGLMLTATSSSASPIAGGLASGSKIFPELNGGLVQNVQAW